MCKQKKNIKIILLFLSFTNFPGLRAQEYKTEKFRVSNNCLQSFMQSQPALRKLSFARDDEDELMLKPDTSLFHQPYYERYQNRYEMSYAGDQYLFSKQFGIFPQACLLGLFDSIRRKYPHCPLTYFKGTIDPSFVNIEMKGICETGKQEDRIFQKINYRIAYKKGKQALAGYLQSFLPDNKHLLAPGDTDSVLLFRILIKRDSLVHKVEPLHPYPSVLSNICRQALLNSQPWIPLQTGGHVVNGYTEVYIRLRSNRHMVVDYRD
jgi:hypothetical protein